MSNQYTEPSISGYDSNPPTDDGANTSANEITWAKHKTKHGDPLKNYSDAINSAITSAFELNLLNAISTHSANYTVLTGDRGKLLDASNTITLTLLAAATAGGGFALAVRNTGSGVITVDGDGSETINGATTLILGIGEHVVLTCDGSSWSGLVGNNFGGTFVKGADVASAGALTLGSDGNYFDITGTTTITSITTRGARGLVKLHFDGILTLTHHATDLVLPEGVNITTIAGEEYEFIEYASGDWRMLNSSRKSGSIVQVVNVLDNAYTACTTVLPMDDTIPQNTEGNEVMTLAITPNSATNKLKIDVVVQESMAAAGWALAALFQDTTADALMAGWSYEAGGSQGGMIIFSHYMTAGTVSSSTFKVRVGPSSGTVYFNGRTAGRALGGVAPSSITITEIQT